MRQRKWGDAMTTGRLLVAGLAVVSTLMAADASAQECPEWFKWLCPDSASSKPAAKEAVQTSQGKELARTEPSSNSASGNKARTTSRSVADIATNSKSSLLAIAMGYRYRMKTAAPLVVTFGGNIMAAAEPAGT